MTREMNPCPESAAEFLFPVPTIPGTPPGTLRLRVAALACGAVRITRTMRDSFLESASPVVVPGAPGVCGITETDGTYLADCGQVTVRVDKETGRITFLDPAGNRILREREKRPCMMEEKPVWVNRFSREDQIRYSESADGVRASAEVTETLEARRAYTVQLGFDFDPEEALYGLGSHEEGYGNLRGRSRDLYQHNMKAVVPFLVSSKGWGILFDLGCLMAFHDDAWGTYLWADCADGTFVWYDDAGDGYEYEEGECALVRFTWKDQKGELTISAREGGWAGMLPETEMHIRRITGKKTVIRYTGEAVTVRL